MLLESLITMPTEHNMDRYQTNRNQLAVNLDMSDRYSNPSSPDKVTSAADAMLKLSTSFPVVFPPNTDMYQSGGVIYSSDGNVSDEGSGQMDNGNRKERLFVPELKKDDQYWIKRRKNNEAAKKSREKRRHHDKILSDQVQDLKQENALIASELDRMKRYYGHPLDTPFIAPGSNDAQRQQSLVVSPSTPVDIRQPPIVVAPLSPVAVPQYHELPAAQSPLNAANHGLETFMPLLISSMLQPTNMPRGGALTFDKQVSTPVETAAVSNPDRKRRHSSEIAIDYSTHRKSARPDNNSSLVIDLTSPSLNNAPLNYGLTADTYERVVDATVRSVDNTVTPPVNVTHLPHKLRHKVKLEERSPSREACDNSVVIEPAPATAPDTGVRPYCPPACSEDEEEPRLVVNWESEDYASSESADRSSPVNNGDAATSSANLPTSVDGLEVTSQKRRNNNRRSAQRYRQQRRQLRQLQDDKAHLLEDENDKLQSEMKHLSGEVQQLRHLIESNISVKLE